MCNCPTCTRGRKVTAVLDSNEPDSIKVLCRSLYEALCETEDSLDHLTAILDGSWPSAVEQLTAALDKAVKRRSESEDI